MTAVQNHLGTLMLLLTCATAQNTAGPATLQNVTTARRGADLRVEVTLSGPVTPSVDTATNPDRILLDLPDTRSNDAVRSLAVHVNGVRRVRAGQHSASPLITRVVLDLDQTHPYTVTTEENKIIVTINAVERARKATQGAPVAATSGNLIGVFRRRHDTAAPLPEDNASDFPTPVPPPTTVGPAFEPPSNSSTVAAVPPPPLTPPIPQSQTAPPAVGTAAASAPAQPSFTQNQIATAAPPPVAPAPSSVSATTPATDAVPVEPVAAPVIAKNKNEEPAAPVTSAPAVPPSPSTETSTMIARSDDPSLRTVFRVKYVAEGVAYLEGGRAQGLKEGMKLEVEDSNLPATQGDSANAADPRVVAELEVSGVAETSAVTDIHSPKRPVKAGDLAYLSSGDTEALVQQRALSATRQYPAVISFTEGDTLDEEAREEVPRPPLPSVNRARGRIGFDDIETISHGTSSVTSSDVGMVFRGDITRIGGTYWNLSGYWRGRLTKESVAAQQTLQNLINRTYHLNMTYDNPNSTLVAGFGRLYLPWAPSLDTIDGGYFGKRLSKGATLGIFGGSTPDPSSWDYSPNRVISGAFINFEGGEYDGFHYSSTSGAGVSMVNWAVDRPFVFFEDSLSYKRDIAIYESAQVDDPQGNSVTPSPGVGLGRNFFTLRVNPHPRVELDFNYNYFRDIPTFDSTLVGTGLLDKYLFQGFSAGGRVEVWKQIWLSTSLGRSSGTGDAKSSLNEMFGITFARLPWVRLRADAHYAKFDSSFGSGSYESISLSRQMSDRLRLEVLLGQQNFASTLTTSNRSRFLTGTVETTLGPHYYLQSSFTTNRGDLSYDQFMFSVGYRFDSKRKGE
jgi:AMIN domain